MDQKVPASNYTQDVRTFIWKHFHRTNNKSDEECYRQMQCRKDVLDWLQKFGNNLQDCLPTILVEACRSPLISPHPMPCRYCVLGSRNVWSSDQNTVEQSERKRRLMIVKVLVERGADLTVRDEMGRTCLMLAATWNLELVQYLVESGEDVNATFQNCDSYQNGIRPTTALHYAVINCQDDIALFLCSNGADVRIRNGAGLDAVKMSVFRLKWIKVDEIYKEARRASWALFEHLSKLGNYSKIEKADCFDLLGCNFVFRDWEQLYESWKKAIELREESDKTPFLTEGEIKTVEQLDEIYFEKNLTSSIYQMIFKMERIAKLNGEDWRHFINNHELSLNILDVEDFTQIIDLLIERPELSLGVTSGLCEKLDIHYSASTEECLIMLEKFVSLSNDKLRSDDISYRQYAVMGVLVASILHKKPTEDELERTKNAVRKIPHDWLQILIPIYLKGKHIFHFGLSNDLEVLEVMLECGSDPSCTDSDGDSALLAALIKIFKFNPVPPQEEHAKVIRLLLRNGAHVDLRNKAGDQTHKLLQKYYPDIWDEIDVLQERSLECLCACVIKDANLPYKQLQLPKKVIRFIDHH